MQKYSVNRRSARVFAMQLLYAMEVTAGTAGECLGGVLNNSPELSSEMKAYGISLVDIAQEHREEFEKIIADTPAKVVLTEAVQIAAKYSTEDSYSFINGILNHVAEMQGIFPSTSKESL